MRKKKKITAEMISHMSKQSLKASPMQNAFVMITIVLASSLLMTILMYATGRKQQEKDSLSHSQQAVYYNLTKEQVEILKQDERLSFQIQVKNGILSEMDGFDIKPCYVNRLTDEIRVGELEQGRLPEGEDEIAVQAALLEKMGIEPAKGSKVTFSFYDGSRESFTVSGIIKGGRKAEQFPVFFSEGYAEHGSQLKDIPYEVYVKLCNAENLSAGSCKEAVYQIGSDAGIERKYISPSKAFLDSLSMDAQTVMLYSLVGAVILLAGVLVIYGVFYLSVIGRIHQFGQLRTLGMTKKQIKRFVFCEGSSLYFGSAPPGILLGAAAGYFILPEGFRIRNTFWTAILVLALIYLFTMISVGRPARLAAAVSPMEALRYVPQDGMEQAGNKNLCRRLTPFGLGVMNFSKNRKKAALTFASLAFGGILFMMAAIYISSFDKENYARQGYFKDAEFHIYYPQSAIELNENGLSGIQAQAPMDQEFVQAVLDLEGVKNVQEIKGFGVSFDYPKKDEYDTDDGIYPLTEEETREISQYLKEGSADYEKLMSGSYVLVSDNDTVEEIYGWRFIPGDRITFHYYDGSRMAEREVEILGVLNKQYSMDNSYFDGWFLMPEEAVLRWLSHDSLNAHLLVAAETDKEGSVEELLSQILADGSKMSMETLKERRSADEQALNQIFGAISGLSLFIMTFSILSMMNTLITNIVTRKQELAMLESIGMDKKQMQKMLLGESFLLVFGAVGAAMTIGTWCGCVLMNALYRMGAFYMAFRFPIQYALAYTGILVLVPLVIIFVSMRSFSKEALVERLKGMEH